MNHPADNERLLTDVLADASPAGFRQALLGETLRLARRRRQLRQTQRAFAALAVLAVAGILAWRGFSPRPAVPKPLSAPGPIVHSRPLDAAAIVTTQPLLPGQITSTVASTHIVTIVTTSGGCHMIGDEELLALAASRPVALVRHGPHEAELIFVNPEDQNGFPVN